MIFFFLKNKIKMFEIQNQCSNIWSGTAAKQKQNLIYQ